ncbi:MAG TPA: hypothetical protein VN112_20580 [Ensifer sp.]|nr:hypothetical protein [Ensifer sp.]
MNGNRIVWGIILVILVVAALAYFGTAGNLNRAVQPQGETQKTEQETH